MKRSVTMARVRSREFLEWFSECFSGKVLMKDPLEAFYADRND